jgi:hypothetical protein
MVKHVIERVTKRDRLLGSIKGALECPCTTPLGDGQRLSLEAIMRAENRSLRESYF